MKKKIFNIAPYIVGLIYLTYCLINIDYWVKSHLGFGICVLIPLIIAVVLAIAVLMLKIFAKKKCKFYLPLFFFAIGLIINIVGCNIDCCIGG